MPAIFNLFKKKSKKASLAPSPVSENPPSSPLAAPVAVNVNHLNSIPEAVESDISNAQASPEDAIPAPPPGSSSTSPASDSQLTATTNDAPVQRIKGSQKYRAEVINNNEAGNGTAQVYEERQQFFAAVTNNNIATSNSNIADHGNTNSTITGDAIIHCDAEGTEIQISQRTTSDIFSPATLGGTTTSQPLASTARSSPPDPTQVIRGAQVFHAEMTNTNTLGSGTAQVIEGEQEFWGPVVNNNSRTINSNRTNSDNVNSTITGNTYRVRETAQSSAPATGSADWANMLANMITNQYGTPNTRTRYLNNSSGQGAIPFLANGNISNAFMPASPEEQMNYQFRMLIAQTQTLAAQQPR